MEEVPEVNSNDRSKGKKKDKGQARKKGKIPAGAESSQAPFPSQPVAQPPTGKSPSSADLLELDWVKKDIEGWRAGRGEKRWRHAGPPIKFFLGLILAILGAWYGYRWFEKVQPTAWEDPYAGAGSWRKANVHTHCRFHDPGTVYELYKKMGYAALAITEWRAYQPQDMEDQTKRFDQPPLFVAMPGSETGFAAQGRHLLIIGDEKDYGEAFAEAGMGHDLDPRQSDAPGKDDKDNGKKSKQDKDDEGLELEEALPDDSQADEPSTQDLLTQMQEVARTANHDGCFVIIPHPNYYPKRWSHDDIISMEGYDAVEIYNALVEVTLAQGPQKGSEDEDEKVKSQSAMAVDLWDELLSSGHRVWGTVGDDFLEIRIRTPGDAWIMVKSENNTKETLIAALKRGSFYCSTGLGFNQIGAKGSSIVVEADRQCSILFIGKDGKVLSETFGLYGEFALESEVPYARVELRDEQGLRAWSQPFFPKKGDS